MSIRQTATSTSTALSGTYATRAQGLAPHRRRPARPAETVVSRFESGHGWTANAGFTATTPNDTTDGFLASQCWTGVVPGTTATCTLDKTGLTAFDPTGKSFTVAVKIDNPQNVEYATLYLGADTFFVNSTAYSWFPSGGAVASAGEWTLLTFSVGSGFLATGVGVGTSATAVRLRISGRNSTSGFTVKFGGVTYWTPTATKGLVSFTFDDAYDTALSAALPVLSKYRYRGTLYPIVEFVGGTSKLTLAQLQDFERVHGWEVGAHATTSAIHGAGLPSLSASALDAELQANKAWLVENGLSADTIAYPGGSSNSAVRLAAGRYYTGGRTTTDGKETLPPAAVMGARSVSLTNTLTLAQAKAAVDEAAAGPQWIIFTVHEIVTTVVSTYQWSTADLTSLVDYIATKTVDVLPMTDALAAQAVPANRPLATATRIKATAAQNIPTATTTTITADTEDFDSEALHSTATNTSRITVPAGKAGKWLVTGMIAYSSHATGSRSLIIRKNGTSVQDVGVATQASGTTTVDTVTITDAVAGDYFDMAAWQNSGATLTTDQTRTYLAATWLGA